MDEKARERVARRSINTGLFEALLLTRCIQDITSDDMKQVKEFVTVCELTEAFNLLTAIIVQEHQELSEDAWAILNEIAERLRVKPEHWHGLKRP